MWLYRLKWLMWVLTALWGAVIAPYVVAITSDPYMDGFSAVLFVTRLLVLPVTGLWTLTLGGVRILGRPASLAAKMKLAHHRP